MITFLKRYVFHDFFLKVLSLLLATGLWFGISRDEQPAEVAVRAPIVFQNVPPDLEINSESMPEAQIRLRGPIRVIRQLRPNEVQAEIDLVNSRPSEHTFDLTSQQVRRPPELEVVQIVPSRLHLSFDTRLSREVPIVPRVTGVFPSDFEVVKKDPDPARITISGPRSHVERIHAATTDPIDATGVQGTAVFTTNAYVSDPLVQVEQATSIRVTVIVQKVGTATTH